VNRLRGQVEADHVAWRPLPVLGYLRDAASDWVCLRARGTWAERLVEPAWRQRWLDRRAAHPKRRRR
jgi:hypothetical protein